ncbi:MAG: hypothetical protein IIC91_15035, partial [Chloroflexi bacterium]|nr:hypothetical protein [Chloroflexota bacterium]
MIRSPQAAAAVLLLVVGMLAVLVLSGQSMSSRAAAGPSPDLTGDWVYAYNVGGPPFVGSCVGELSQSATTVTSVTFACGGFSGVFTATIIGLDVVGQVDFSGTIVDFEGTVDALGDEQIGVWGYVSDPVPLANGYAALRLIATGTGPTTVDVPPGPNTGAGGSVTFEAVTDTGGTQIILGGPTSTVLPQNFQLHPPDTIYNVVTTATVTGDINVCINYEDSDNNGFVDGTSPAIDETTLQLLHEEAGSFVDRTEPSKKDHVNNTICAIVSSLSEFALGVPEAAPPPPVGGIALDGDVALRPLASPESSSSFGVLAWAITASAGAVALGGAGW